MTTMNLCLIPNGKLIVFTFPAGGGGKMLQNCVGLSRHCVLNHCNYLNWQVNYSKPIDSEYYQQKLQWILKTVPDTDQMHNWLAYEIDKDLPYGITWTDFRAQHSVANLNYYQAAKQGLWATISMHTYKSTFDYGLSNYWPTLKHVCLSNCEKFARQSLSLKNKALLFDENWPKCETDPDVGFHFDVDNTIYDHDKFISQVEELYNYLEFDDFQADLVSIYWKKYIAIHPTL